MILDKAWGICGMTSEVMPAARILLQLIADFVVYLGLLIRRRKAIAAENLFLRRQLALYQERKVGPRRIDRATRITLALLSKLFNWRDALIVVQPKTLIRWHRAGLRLLWHWKSKPGRPPIPAELRRLIREMSRDNLLWARLWTTWSSLNASGFENLLKGFGSNGVAELTPSARDKEMIVTTGTFASE